MDMGLGEDVSMDWPALASGENGWNRKNPAFVYVLLSQYVQLFLWSFRFLLIGDRHSFIEKL